MKYRITTLTPVHIGSGNNLEPFEYITENSKFYRIDQNKFFRAATQKYPDFPEKFVTWIEEKTEKISMISSRDYKAPKGTDKNKMLQDERSSFNLKSFIRFHYKDQELANFINKEAYLYKCDVSYGLSGRKQISELLKDHNYQPYIPGSSLRGALRSAIAFRAFETLDKDLKTKLFEEVIKSRSFENRNSRSHKLDEPIERELFLCGYKRKGELKFDDIKFDLMKFIKISDASGTKVNKFEILVPNLYSVGKEPQSQLNAFEVIEPGSEFEFEVSVDVKAFTAAMFAANSQNADKWIGFNSKIKRLFGFDPVTVSEHTLESRIIEGIENALKQYYGEAENHTRTWLKKASDNYNMNNTKYQNIIRAYDKLGDSKEIKLNFAWGSGFEVKTLYFAALRDEQTKKFMQEIFNRFEIGVPRNRNIVDKTPPKLENFPKSKRMLFDQFPEMPQSALGWLELKRDI